MKKIVISQPMFFPWPGLFEQIRLADIFVHYDDVQLPQGRSFISRVQIKTPSGVQWLTAPVVQKEKQSIKDAILDEAQPWRTRHLKTLKMNYARAPFAGEMLDLAEKIYTLPTCSLCEFDIFAIETISKYFGLEPVFQRSSAYMVEATSSMKLIALVKALEGTVYITGHGARNYLDHQAFEALGISVVYMDYQRVPYPQLHGSFTPYVSILDLIANTGRMGINYLISPTIGWKEFVRERS